MLNDHTNSTAGVIGRWKNTTVSGHQLTAESDFDTEDLETKAVAGKVERGFIKGASMGISFNPTNMKLAKDGVYELTKCDLFEASICAIPSNENSLSLFAQNGVRLSEDQVKIQLSTFNTNNMNLSNTLTGMLGLTPGSSDQSIIDCIKKILAEKESEMDGKIEKMLTLAVKEYNLDYTEKDFWKQAALKDFDTIERMLLAPGKKRTRLGDTIKNNGSNSENRMLWTLEDYREKDPKALESNPELFKQLWDKETKLKGV